MYLELSMPPLPNYMPPLVGRLLGRHASQGQNWCLSVDLRKPSICPKVSIASAYQLNHPLGVLKQFEVYYQWLIAL